MPAGELEAELGRVVEALGENSGPVMRRAVKALRGTRSERFSAELSNTEKIYVDELLKLEDAREGVEAFMQKRKPRWSRSRGPAT